MRRVTTFRRPELECPTNILSGKQVAKKKIGLARHNYYASPKVNLDRPKKVRLLQIPLEQVYVIGHSPWGFSGPM